MIVTAPGARIFSADGGGALPCDIAIRLPCHISFSSLHSFLRQILEARVSPSRLSIAVVIARAWPGIRNPLI
jgi:hypothetical protein